MAAKPKGNPFARQHLRAAYRSGLEVAVAAALTLAGVPFQYEALRLPFTQPEKKRTYTPDVILENGTVCELKGLFTAEDREKHLLVKAAHPALRLKFVFTNPNAKISKASKTTYADWCRKHGYEFAKKDIPKEWIEEKSDAASLAALRTLGWKPSG